MGIGMILGIMLALLVAILVVFMVFGGFGFRDNGNNSGGGGTDGGGSTEGGSQPSSMRYIVPDYQLTFS